jgi:hypothetical protein
MEDLVKILSLLTTILYLVRMLMVECREWVTLLRKVR